MDIEPAALALVKAMSDKLATAKTMSFTALATYESPDHTGEPLAYATLSEVTLQRPDKLRVISPGDGPRTEFYYDGKTSPGLRARGQYRGHRRGARYDRRHAAFGLRARRHLFPFHRPHRLQPDGDDRRNLAIAFVVGKSTVIGGVTTDIVVLVGKYAHVQLWVGSEDKLPRMARAVFLGDPSHYRHTAQFSDWKIDPTLPANTFTFTAPAGAVRVAFASPGAPPPSPTKK